MEERLRRLEEQLVAQPSIEEYLAAKHREEVRALHKVAGLLAPHGFDGGYLFTEVDRRMLAEGTQERQDRDIVERWRRAQDRDQAVEVEGAKEKLLPKLEARSYK